MEESLRVAKAQLSVYLHPSMSDNVEQGVVKLIGSLLLKYNEEFDASLLSFFDLKICERNPKLLPGLTPYLSLKIQAKLLLFSPKPGMLLEGTVNKVKEDFIGAVVLGIYNVGIGYADIHDGFYYQTDENGENPEWTTMTHGENEYDADSEHVIGIGTRIKFTVKRLASLSNRTYTRAYFGVIFEPLDHSVQVGTFLDIIGSLKLPNTGSMKWLLSSKQDEDGCSERKTVRKDKTREKHRRKSDSVTKIGGNDVADVSHRHGSKRIRTH